MSENGNSRQVSGYLTAAVIGAVVGASLALLYAPCSGEETRKRLAERAKDIKDRAQSAMEDAKKFISRREDDVKEAVEKGKETIRAERSRRQV